ncbi:glycoside hydrolase family 88 protein [Pedobacter sp. KR3-3]|uniref:Glycoside hydrolase family 88 protein n=1 Tax=Pedobacter albus TaxID=3113905 RepID=A0ABU7IBW5_9SPHI|nr:glycoside hydrolase family 88 protein [Pedobacter sp. KR3-3]MEE1946983.1 glycoside hydrolase family 88 protein [Pedobacter sp. KR3-3]
MIKRINLILLLVIALSPSFAQVKDKAMANLIDRQFKLAQQQYQLLGQNTPATRMPKTYYAAKNKWESSDTQWWCSGFYPGSLLYIYEYTKDTATLSEAKKRLAVLEKEKHYTGNHDLGFMMYCSFGNAYRITHNPLYRPTLDTAAASLVTRYRPDAKVIQSWNASKTWKGPVIIDNMMNLELLLWVSQNGGDKKLRQIALNHADATLKNHFRKDYSSYHVVDYDMSNGNVVKKATAQGAADESAWARGQAWGLYGYTMMYRFTKDKRYLEQAKHIADFILKNPALPADGIPYWDFNAPNIPNTYRDASAGAIIASALLELGQYSNKKEQAFYLANAKKMLVSLSGEEYTAKAGTNGGFLLKHSVGALPSKSEVDVPLTYADYYYLEALLRYKNWYL